MNLPLSIINQQITFQHILTHNKNLTVFWRGKKRKKKDGKKNLPVQSSQCRSFHQHWWFLAIEPSAPTCKCHRQPQSSAPAQLHPHTSPAACTPTPTRRLVQRGKALRWTETIFSSSMCIYLQLFLLQVIHVPTLSFSLRGFSPPHFIPLTFVDGATVSPLSLGFARLNKLHKLFSSAHKTTHFPEKFDLSFSVLLSTDVSWTLFSSIAYSIVNNVMPPCSVATSCPTATAYSFFDASYDCTCHNSN